MPYLGDGIGELGKRKRKGFFRKLAPMRHIRIAKKIFGKKKKRGGGGPADDGGAPVDEAQAATPTSAESAAPVAIPVSALPVAPGGEPVAPRGASYQEYGRDSVEEIQDGPRVSKPSEEELEARADESPSADEGTDPQDEFVQSQTNPEKKARRSEEKDIPDGEVNQVGLYMFESRTSRVEVEPYFSRTKWADLIDRPKVKRRQAVTRTRYATEVSGLLPETKSGSVVLAGIGYVMSKSKNPYVKVAGWAAVMVGGVKFMTGGVEKKV